MRAIRLAPVVVLLFLVLAACSPTGSDTGVGPDLYTASLPENTKAQNDYVAAICTQAGGQVIQLANSVDCSDRDGWSTFVQAGMNDIDARCDAYLVWLDRRKRSSKPFLNQLAKTEEVTTTIVNSVSPGTAITVLTAVFGLARDTFNNINSVVLLETIDHSTVQSLVLRRQKAFRDATLGKPVSSRPAAIYALRSYLRICMPITIATDINTTISTFERTNEAPKALIDAETVARTMIASPTAPLIVQPPAPTQTSYPENLPAKHIQDVQTSLCVPVTKKADSATVAAVAAYLDALGNGATAWNAKTDKLIPIAIKCSDMGLRNPAEAALLGSEGRLRDFQGILKALFLLKDPSLVIQITGKMDDQTRKAIAKARGITKLDQNLGSADRIEQVDKMLFNEVVKIVEKG